MKKQKNKGISLIVLVITIVLMIILAATIVISLSNSGIIDKANDAVDATNLKQVQNLASMLWADAYAGGARTQADLETAVLEGLGDIENIDLDSYTVTVTETGVTVEKTVILTPSEKYYGVANVVPTNAEYFEYDYDTTNMTATLTGVKDTYSEIAYYVWENNSEPYTSAIIDENGTKITDVVVPYETIGEDGEMYTITAIGSNAFGAFATTDNTGISTSHTSFMLPNTITSIGAWAFHRCISLTSITIPDSVENIGGYAFAGCSSLTSVTIGGEVAGIGRLAFYRCSELASAIFENTSGWTANSTSIDVSDAATAATYLKSTYNDGTWTRTDAE